MTTKPLVVTPENRPRALNIVGEKLTVLVAQPQASGYEIFLQEGVQGSGPPTHHHPWDEAFYVLEGDVEFGSGDARQVAAAGDLVHVPAGTPHWFRFGADGGRMLSVTGAGSEAAAFFTAVDAAMAADDADPARLDAVGRRHSLNFG